MNKIIIVLETLNVEVIMAISMNNVMNNEVRGFNAVKSFKQAVTDAIFARTIVVNKVEIVIDNKTKEETVRTYLGTTNDSPIVNEFGLNYDYRKADVLVEMKDEMDESKSTPIRLNIDGVKNIMSDNIMIITCEDAAKIKELAENGFDFNGEHYIACNASPSNEKHGSKYYCRINDKVTCERDAYKIVDKVSGGVFSHLLEENGPINGKLITKLNTRFGNYAAPMTLFGTIDLSKDYIAIVHKAVGGSIVGAYDFDETTREEMENNNIEIDNHINDGANYYGVEFVQEWALKTFNVRLSTTDALRVAMQNRATGVTGKTMNRTLRQNTMNKIAKANNATFYGNRNGRLVALFDEDGAKALNMSLLNNKGTINVYVMAVAWASEAINTSSQLLIKYISLGEEAHKKTIDFMKNQTEEALMGYIMNQTERVTSTTITSEIIAELGDEAMTDAILMESIIKDSYKYIQAAIAKNKLKVNGMHSHMMFDLTYALTEGRLNNILGITPEGFVEAYSADINKRYAKEIAEIENNKEMTKEEQRLALQDLLSGVVIKYPTAMSKEYEIVVYLTKQQVLDRIAESNISNTDKAELKDYFLNTPWGCTVYAPINAMKNKLAGADCDFDATDIDMSELKYILMNERAKQRETIEGFMGDCTIISYKERKDPELYNKLDLTIAVEDANEVDILS
jgi:hypothetical protein